MASAMLCSLIKHAKISELQSLFDLFSLFDSLTRLSNQIGLQLSFQSRVASPAALQLMKMWTFPIEITKQGAQSQGVKLRNSELYLKGAGVRTPGSLLQQDCPNQRQSWKDQTVPTGSTPNKAENIDYSSASDDTKLLRFVEVTKQTTFTTQQGSVV